MTWNKLYFQRPENMTPLARGGVILWRLYYRPRGLYVVVRLGLALSPSLFLSVCLSVSTESESAFCFVSRFSVYEMRYSRQ